MLYFPDLHIGQLWWKTFIEVLPDNEHFLHSVIYDVCVHLVAKSCPTLYDPVDCSPPGSSVYGIFMARILEWVAISSSREAPDIGCTHVSCISGLAGGFYHWATGSYIWYYYLISVMQSSLSKMKFFWGHQSPFKNSR